MRDDLVAEEIEIEPIVRRAPFATSKKLSIEGACFGEIVNRECEMEAGLLRHWMKLANGTAEKSKVPA
jgi:hypothetical protein